VDLDAESPEHGAQAGEGIAPLPQIRPDLPLAEREAAAAQLVRTHPQWSDRAIADAAGIAATTVSKIRLRYSDGKPAVRIGRDGRVRPINGAAGRRLASRLLTDHPGASLRWIAEAAGISPTTVKDVRERMNRGEDPVPLQLAFAEQKTKIPPYERRRPATDPALVLRKLRLDPALRLSDSGRRLLRGLAAIQDWDHATIPAHCVPVIVELLLGLADSLEQREPEEQG
jgi:hypothetical protein